MTIPKTELYKQLEKELRRNRILAKERDSYKYETFKLKRTIRYIVLVVIALSLLLTNYYNFGI